MGAVFSSPVCSTQFFPQCMPHDDPAAPLGGDVSTPQLAELPPPCQEMTTKDGSSQSSLLLELQQDCLVAVLKRCAADDRRSFLNAAQAHSKLYAAASLVLRMIQHSMTEKVAAPSRVDSLMLFVGKHCKLLDSLSVMGPACCAEETETPHGTLVIEGPLYMCRAFALRQLPPIPKLRSLVLGGLGLQLTPGGGFPGVVTAGSMATLTQLQLRSFSVLDDGADEALAAALPLLPAGLNHLQIRLFPSNSHAVQFPTGALPRLQQLTCLELAGMQLRGPDEASPPLQPLQALTRLADLQLMVKPSSLAAAGLNGRLINSSMLSAAQNLTRLQHWGEMSVVPEGLQMVRAAIETGVLAGKTQLQHLDLDTCLIRPEFSFPGVTAQLMSRLQDLQQLTHLNLSSTAMNEDEGPPAAAYSALTASSKLQYLNLEYCTLPTGVWQHLFPTGKRLPHLQSLRISQVEQPDGTYAAAPEGSRLVSCCPGLQLLHMRKLQCSAEMLTPLQELSGLHSLCLNVEGTAADECLEAVCQLTGLRDLDLNVPIMEDGFQRQLTQLTQLKKLTELQFRTYQEDNSRHCMVRVTSSCGWHDPDPPVWLELLRELKYNEEELDDMIATTLGP